MVTDWKNEYGRFDIEFPIEFDDELNNIIAKAKKIYTNYINNKINDEEVKKFEIYIKDFDYLINKKCKKHYEQYNNDRYVCTKKIASWLRNMKHDGILAYIKQNGFITEDFAKYVAHKDFISKFKKEIKDSFMVHNIKLVDINESNLNFTYRFKIFEPIKLQINIGKFTNDFYNIFYGKSEFELSELKDKLYLKNDYKNIYEYLGILETFVKENKYYFEIEQGDNNSTLIELNEKGTNQMAYVELDKILNTYVNALYMNKDEAEEYILRLIKDEEWINRKDKDKFNIGDISRNPYS